MKTLVKGQPIVGNARTLRAVKLMNGFKDVSELYKKAAMFYRQGENAKGDALMVEADNAVVKVWFGREPSLKTLREMEQAREGGSDGKA